MSETSEKSKNSCSESSSSGSNRSGSSCESYKKEIGSNPKKYLKKIEELELKLKKSNKILTLSETKNKELKKKLDLGEKYCDYTNEEKKDDKSKKSNQKDETQYDLVINIDSLLSANSLGWEVSYNDIEHVKQCFLKEQVALGMIGRENVGKTFIINKICDGNFASGYYTNTKGLSIKYCDEKKKQLKVLLDSAGMNAAIFFYNKDEIEKYMLGEQNKKIHMKEFERIKEEMINDRCMTEYFIQNFILYACNIIVIVVELLTENDQKIIERIKHLYNEKKTIIIIHNLFKLELKEHVIKRASYEIEGAFNGIKQIIPDSDEVPFFIEKIKNQKNKNIVHFVLGKENSESGNYFNKATFKQFRKTIESEIDIEKFDLLTKLNRYWVEKNRIYFNDISDLTEKVKFKEEKQKKEKGKNDVKYFYKLDLPSIKLRLKVPEFNVLGALKDLDINYHVFEVSNPNREKIYYFELPGISEKPDMVLKKLTKEHEQVLTLSIKKGAVQPEGFKCTLGGFQTADYVKKIKINDDYGEYICDKKFTKLENGVLKVKFVLEDSYEI